MRQAIDAAVAQSKQEILADMASGTVPTEVRTFSALHDYVDANVYGGLCDDGASFTIEQANEIQSRVDEWLRSRRDAGSI